MRNRRRGRPVTYCDRTRPASETSFPDPAESFPVLPHTERVASELKQPNQCPAAAVAKVSVLPVKLWHLPVPRIRTSSSRVYDE